MVYSTTITSKGQITIPKEVRDFLRLEEGKRIFMNFERKTRKVTIKPSEDFLDLADSIKVAKKIDPVKAREYMEEHYERA